MATTGRLSRPEVIAPGMGVPPAVALVDPKYGHNAAGALRACAAFGIRQLWISGRRVTDEWEGPGRLPREERMRSYGGVDVIAGEYFFDAFGPDTVPVAVEVQQNAEPLTTFEHPEKALYIFGPEDGGLGRVHLRECHRFVIIPSDHCLNLAVAVGAVLLDRRMKRQRDGLEPIRPSYRTLNEQRGFIDNDDPLDW